MPHDSLPEPGSAAQWLWYAEGDLMLARTQAFSSFPIELPVARYPGDYEPNSEEAHLDALTKAEETLLWAQSICKSNNK